MNPKKTCFRVSVGLVFLISFLLSNTLLAQVSNKYIIYNKTECTTDVTARCSDGSSSSATMAPEDFLSDSCSAGEYLCYVLMEFPSSYELITVVPATIAPICLSPLPDIDSDPCYQENVVWDDPPNYITCNIY